MLDYVRNYEYKSKNIVQNLSRKCNKKKKITKYHKIEDNKTALKS